MSPRAEPVRVIKPDGSSHVASAHDFRNRPPEAEDAAKVTEDGQTLHRDVSMEALESMARFTLFMNMRDGDSQSTRNAAAATTIKYLAIKYRVGPIFGEELDE